MHASCKLSVFVVLKRQSKVQIVSPWWLLKTMLNCLGYDCWFHLVCRFVEKNLSHLLELRRETQLTDQTHITQQHFFSHMFKLTSRSPLADFCVFATFFSQLMSRQGGRFWWGGEGQINVEGTCAESINLPAACYQCVAPLFSSSHHHTSWWFAHLECPWDMCIFPPLLFFS